MIPDGQARGYNSIDTNFMFVFRNIKLRSMTSSGWFYNRGFQIITATNTIVQRSEAIHTEFLELTITRLPSKEEEIDSRIERLHVSLVYRLVK